MRAARAGDKGLYQYSLLIRCHAKSDASGDIIAFNLTGGKASDARYFETLLHIGPDIKPRAAICDKGYASKANRAAGFMARRVFGGLREVGQSCGMHRVERLGLFLNSPI